MIAQLLRAQVKVSQFNPIRYRGDRCAEPRVFRCLQRSRAARSTNDLARSRSPSSRALRALTRRFSAACWPAMLNGCSARPETDSTSPNGRSARPAKYSSRERSTSWSIASNYPPPSPGRWRHARVSVDDRPRGTGGAGAVGSPGHDIQFSRCWSMSPVGPASRWSAAATNASSPRRSSACLLSESREAICSSSVHRRCITESISC
jgi:hypothetical protein